MDKTENCGGCCHQEHKTPHGDEATPGHSILKKKTNGKKSEEFVGGVHFDDKSPLTPDQSMYLCRDFAEPPPTERLTRLTS